MPTREQERDDKMEAITVMVQLAIAAAMLVIFGVALGYMTWGH